MEVETVGGSSPAGARSTSATWLLVAAAPALAVGAGVFWLAYDDGTYGVSARSQTAIVVWWALGLAMATGVASLRRLPRAVTTTAGLLLAFAAWTGVSAAWSPSPGDAFAELARVLLYLGLFLLVALAAVRFGRERIVHGLELGITSVVALALVSRLFPGVAGSTAAFRFLPVLGARLNYPLGYWNGLAFLAALAVPLLLAGACGDRPLLLRAATLAPLPAVVAALYLTSSRGGLVAAALAVAVFVVATPGRLRAVAALATASIGGAAAVAVLHARPELVNRPDLATPGQRHGAALAVIGLCAAVGVVYAAGDGLLGRRMRIPGVVDRSVLAAFVLVVAAAVAAAHPVRRFEQFKTLQVTSTAGADYVEQHVLSAGGNGRWQLWSSALDEFRSDPLRGRGAGSFAGWWQQHRAYPLYVRDAHSGYLQTLGELGIVGFLVLVALLLVPLGAGIRRWAAARGTDRIADAGLLASFVVFLLGIGVDWMWQLPAVAATGTAVGALLAFPANPVAVRRAGPKHWVARGLVVAVVVAVLVVEAIPLLADQRLQASARAAGRGDLSGAVSAAQDARSIEPWDAGPYVQLALLAEQAGRYGVADRWIHEAIRRRRTDWTLWLVATRVETEAGNPRLARSSLAEARRLNPLGVRSLLH